MAVVKTSFTRSREAAKAHVKYITHRPGQDGERVTRTLFGPDERVSRRQAYRMIDRAGERTYFYRIMLSPDPRHEDRPKDLDFRQITDFTMLQLQDRFQNRHIQFVAAIHADHRPHRHVHIMALLPGRLRREDLQALRQAATAAALAQRQELDQAHGRTPKRLPKHSTSRAVDIGKEERIAAPARHNPTCPNCGPGSSMDRRGRFYECPNCGLRVSRSFGIGLEIERESDGLELSFEEGGRHD